MARLADECIRFAKQAGYKKLSLWTNKGLDAAKGIYERRGFQLIEESPVTIYGDGVIGQAWELAL